MSNATNSTVTDTNSNDERAQPVAVIDTQLYYSAQDLQDDGYVKCACCGEWVEESSTIDTQDGAVCEDCINDYVVCDECETYIHLDNAYAVNKYLNFYDTPREYYMCPDCANAVRYVTECACCGETYDAAALYGDADSQLLLYNGEYADVCPSCAMDLYTTCEQCGEWVPLDEVDDDGSCPHCHVDDDLTSYTHTSDLVFHDYKPSSDESGLYMGVELETENYDNERTASRVKDAVATCVGCERDSVVCKRDGSLDDGGCEIVTAPFTPALHLDTNFWNTVCSAPDDVSDNCGVHVHVSRAYFDNDIERYAFIRLFYRFGYRFRHFAGRQSGTYNIWDNAKTLGIDLSADPETRFSQFQTGYLNARGNHGRYTVINTYPYSTIEIRAFAATLDPDVIRDYVAVVYANAVIAHTTPNLVETIERYSFDEYKQRVIGVIDGRFPDYDTSGIIKRFV